MSWLAGIFSAGLAGLVKILLDYLWNKVETEIRAALREQGKVESDAAVAEMVAEQLRKDLEFDVRGKTVAEVDKESEDAWDKVFDNLDKRS